MTRIHSSSGAQQIGNRAPDATRDKMLEMLNQAVNDQGGRSALPIVELEYIPLSNQVGLPNGHVGCVFSQDVVNSVAIDREAGEFYISDDDCSRGPLKLPQGFSYQALFHEPHSDPKAKTPGQETLRSLSMAIRRQKAEVFNQPRTAMKWDHADKTWRTPDGDRLHNVRTRETHFEYGEQSYMFDMRHRRFWLQQNPGTSEGCTGPFQLPRGIRLDDIKVLAAESAVIVTPDSYAAEPYNRAREVIGGDTPRSISNLDGVEGDNASSVYWNNR